MLLLKFLLLLETRMQSLFLHVPHDVTDHVVLEGEHLVDVPSVDSVFNFPNE